MSNNLAPEHAYELLVNPLEELLHGSAVTNKGTTKVVAGGRNITNGGLDVAWDPLNKVSRVLALYVYHLLIDLIKYLS